MELLRQVQLQLKADVNQLNRRIPQLEILDRRAGSYFDRLESFLGSQNVDKKLSNIEREFKTERGIYKEYWLKPQRRWWLGIKEARLLRSSGKTFADRLNETLMEPLETAARIGLLYRDMPELVKRDYKNRILGADSLRPVLFELETASQFVLTGCKIDWLLSEPNSGRKTAEYQVSKGGIAWEVECKTKGVNAGRRVERQAFYRLADDVVHVIHDAGFSGTCRIRISDRLPIKLPWRRGIVAEIGAMMAERRQGVSLSDGTQISLEIVPRDQTVLNDKRVQEIMDSKQHHEQLAIFGPLEAGIRLDPVLVFLSSMKPDRFLNDVHDNLREASEQFSGKSAGVICCFVPEIDSFSGLEKTSALKNMTVNFFEKHAPEFIHSVLYASDNRINPVDRGISETSLPTLRFYNHKCRAKLPDEVFSKNDRGATG